MRELRCGKVSSTAEVRRIDGDITNPLDRLRQQNLLDPVNTITSQNLRAESEWFKIVRDDGRSINCGQSGESVHGRLQCNGRSFETLFLLLEE